MRRILWWAIAIQRHDYQKPPTTYGRKKFGIHTFTVATVYGALICASKFAKLLGKEKSEQIYMAAAFEIRQALLTYLYDDAQGIFVKMINVLDDGTIIYDRTLDMSSVYGVFAFGVLDVHDPRLTRAVKQVEERLVVKTEVSGSGALRG